MSTNTAEAIELDPIQAAGLQPPPSASDGENPLEHLLNTLKTVTGVIKETKTLVSLVVGASMSITAVMSSSADIVSNLSEVFHGSSTHMSDNLRVEVRTDKEVAPLTMKICRFDAQEDTMHLAYLLVEGEGTSNTEPFVLIRKPCNDKRLKQFAWINPADSEEIRSQFNDSKLSELDAYITYTRAELYQLDYLLEKAQQLATEGEQQ